MSDIHTRDAVIIPDLNGYTIPVYPPLYIRATTENIPARIDRAEFSKDQAELLARTVAPQLFPEEGTEPWRKPVREIYKDLQETEQSYRRDRNAAAAGDWTATQVRDSLTDLLDNVRRTLDKLEELL